jgi:endonuclease YncB( thermonuclease family)
MHCSTCFIAKPSARDRRGGAGADRARLAWHGASAHFPFRTWSLRFALALAAGTIAHGALAAQPDGPLWPETPKRIGKPDPALERLPARAAEKPPVKIDPYPLKLDRRLPSFVLDSVSFIQKGKKYRLTELDPVVTSKTCRRADGQRWACGLRSRVALSQLLRGNKPVRCAPRGEAEGFTLVECLRGDKDIGGTLVAAGHALAPDGKGRYRDEQDDAKLNKAGVWADDPASAP